jgi:hypothetical protein
MAGENDEITQLLRRSQDRDAEAKVFELLLPDLRKIAACCFRNERSGLPFNPQPL